MKRSILTIVVAVVLIIAVVVVVVINFGKYKENKYSKFYSIAEEKIVEQEKKDNLNDYKTFVVMEKYGEKEDGNKLYVYAYVCAENYYKDSDGNVVIDSGFSIPHRFEFENEEYVGYKIPQDGSYYEESLNEMYPIEIKMKMDFSQDKYNLGDKTKQMAAQYYGVNVDDIKSKEQ